ncbi:sll0787 family AIR synthase-like protein [Nodosilinea sp. LEGE 07298]|uniref:sll0787 family AIR synthase-like protein n=1 Tax=Nodosilinea sp. LEGE 07298 TaxID=2777970 RepID=UPI0018827FB5|nr:sll0787 family AIR synthase-like protein [Nodosilinea sp. LEGE 07298]MBE9112875.1 sll0787 family AIR synthase-like protein [Nodosilinea sp. LEGE 07298]
MSDELTLEKLAAELRRSLGILHKQDIQTAADRLGAHARSANQEPILLGDDCAAIPDGDGYLLLAAEGIWPTLVETDPWFAGWCAVMVNVSDIYAMGGRPIAVVDTVWSQSPEAVKPLWQGMVAGSQAFSVPIVGGHTSCHSPYTALSVAILGRANRLITSFSAQPGDVLLHVTDMQGEMHPQYPFWNAATEADCDRLQANLALLPALAESGLCDTGKDISMGGIVGTALMLLETSGCGAVLDLGAIAPPPAVDLLPWLLSFPSYGYLLSVRPKAVAQIQPQFHNQGLVCQPVGTITAGQTLTLKLGNAFLCFWDFATETLTGFGGGNQSRQTNDAQSA